MKMNATGMRIGVTVLALGVSLLAIPTLLEAQKAARISRVGWLEVCGPGPRRPHFARKNIRQVTGRKSRGPLCLSSSGLRRCRFRRGLVASGSFLSIAMRRFVYCDAPPVRTTVLQKKRCTAACGG